jgi:hypothetical protein
MLGDTKTKSKLFQSRCLRLDAGGGAMTSAVDSSQVHEIIKVSDRIPTGWADEWKAKIQSKSMR